LTTKYSECFHETKGVQLKTKRGDITYISDSCDVCAGILKTIGFREIN